MSQCDTSSLEIRASPDVISARELCALYEVVGWNTDGWRTLEKVERMLAETRFYIALHDGPRIVAFGRVLGDVFAAQILDVMTHPLHRRRGMASLVMNRLMEYCRRHYSNVHLIDGTGISGFYERFGFEPADPSTNRVLYCEAGALPKR